MPAIFSTQYLTETWLPKITEMTDGRIEIVLTPNGSVVLARETPDAVAAGVLDGDYTSVNCFAGLEPACAIMGDLISGYARADVGFLQGRARQGDDAEGCGLRDRRRSACHRLRPLFARGAARPGADPHVRGSRRQEDPFARRAGRGGVPGRGQSVSIPFPEVFGALEKGIVYAADASACVNNDATGLHDMAPYPLYPGIHSMPFTINTEKWEALSPEDQQALKTRWYDAMFAMAAEVGKLDKALAERDSGGEKIEVIDWEQEDRDKLRVVAREQWVEYAKKSALAQEAPFPFPAPEGADTKPSGPSRRWDGPRERLHRGLFDPVFRLHRDLGCQGRAALRGRPAHGMVDRTGHDAVCHGLGPVGGLRHRPAGADGPWRAAGITTLTVSLATAILNFGTRAGFFIVAANVPEVLHKYELIAVPFPVFMANVPERSGIAKSLFDSVAILSGRFRGSVGVQTCIVAVVLAAMSGIMGGEIVMLGPIALPQMLRLGHDKKLSIGIICAAGTLATLLPPPVVLIIYGLAAQVSIRKYFAASAVPGLILAGLYTGCILVRVRLNPAMAPIYDIPESGLPFR